MATCYSHLSSFALTDVGCKRKNNEDAHQMYPEHGVFIVADGMGGAEDGEVASQAIVDELTKTLKGFDPAQPLSCPAMQAWICHSINEASAWILRRSNDRSRAGTGSTFVGVCFDPEHPDRAVGLHAGDSRVYRIRGGEILQVTRDHSLANAAGITDERELNPKFRGVILRAVGLAVTTEVEATPFDVAEGDTVIVCSDGLSKMIEDAAIAKIVHEEPNTEVAVRQLIDAALKHGGKDNVTVIAVKVGPLPEPLPVTELKVAFPTDFGHSKTDSNPTPQTPIDVNASPATQQTDYRTPLAPVSFDKPPPPNRKRMPVLLIVIIALVIAALCGAGLGLFFKMQEKKAAEAMEKVHEEARQSALQQIRLAEEAEVKKQAEAEARRLQEEASQKEAARLKAEQEARKIEAERKAEEERLKLEAQKAEELRKQALEAQRKAEEAATKAAAEKKALAARQKAEAEQKLALERQRIEAERQRLVAEKQKAEEEATRLAAAVAAGNGDAVFTERERAVLHLVRLAKHEAQAKAYCTFMVLYAAKSMETSPLVTNYDQARQALVQWSDSQILTAQKLKQLTEEQLAPIHNYARALSVFLSTNAVELYAKRTRMKEPAKKIWERLVKESVELRSLAMDNDSTRLRLVRLVETLSAEAK